jgi:hypothetical protein
MLKVTNNSFYNLSQRVKNFWFLVKQEKNQSVLEDKVAQPYRNDAWVLSKRDSEIILDAMENPPAPSKALLSVFE